MLAIVCLLTVTLTVVLPPVSFAIILTVVVLSSNKFFAVIWNANPATATLCASVLLPINVGVVGNVPGLANGWTTLISAIVLSAKIAVYPKVEFPEAKLLVFGVITAVSPADCNVIEGFPTVITNWKNGYWPVISS